MRADGSAVSGTFGSRIQFFSNDAGGTPVGGAIEAPLNVGEKGEFDIPLTAGVLPGPAEELWFCLLVDVDKNGLTEADYVIGNYNGGRKKVLGGPFEAKVKEAPAATLAKAEVKKTSVSQVRVEYSIPSNFVVNVRDMGAKGDGVTDDTKVIQAAIDRLKPTGGRVYFPPGSYSIRSLDLTNRSRLMLTGPATLATTLVAREEGVHMLDLTGSGYVQIENLAISSGQVVPKTAILLCQNEHWSGNATHLENLYVSGHFSVATMYCFGFQSSDVLNCDFYNYKPDDSPVIYFSMTNRAGVTSEFTEVSKKGIITSDWTFTACEIHSFAAQHGGPSKASALVLDGTQQMRWIGGNISGSGPQYVWLRGTLTWILFQGTTFYSDNGTPAEQIFKLDERVNGLSVDQCHVQVARAVIAAEPKAILDTLSFTSYLPQDRPDASENHEPMYVVDAPEGIIANSLVHCSRRRVRAARVEGTLLLDAGKVEGEMVGSMALGVGTAGIAQRTAEK